jgi:enamine deaminase RidA (YjgF/YER057c/UK114 family)
MNVLKPDSRPIVYLASPAFDPANVAVLKRRLGDHHAARTVVCAGLLEDSWLVEIEAVAAQE